MELKIEEKLRDVLIPLTDEKFTALEEDILRNGCIQPIIVWNGTIVDGHNRYAICQKHGIPFKTVEHDFADMTEARLWVYTSETNKRDATIFQKCEMAMRFKDDVESQAIQRILDGPNQKPSQNFGEDPHKRRTDFILGKMAGVSSETMRMAIKLHDEAKEETLNKLRSSDDLKISKAYGMEFKKTTVRKSQPVVTPAEGDLTDYDASKNPYIGNPEDLPGIKMIGAHGVHVATMMEDVPESFPMVLTLFDSVIENYLVSLENTFNQYTPGMRTEEFDRVIDSRLRDVTRKVNEMKKNYKKQEDTNHE